jgi:phosphoribosylaminoimidazole-succinocarboxamide synthase
MFPVEFVVRGYLSGSGWKEYREHGTVCGIPLPKGLKESEKLDAPLFTPATKASSGHDINISPQEAAEIIGADWARAASDAALALYTRARDMAASKGLILCDTKFEFGLYEGALMLADEVLTPDSSRYWPASDYQPGRGQPSYDKQYVRDWLETTGWDKNSPPPALPADVVAKTREKYVEAYRRLTGRDDF